MKKNSLAIILVNYNGSFWVKKTLLSLQQYYLKKTKNKVEIWLVDNASTDDSLAQAQASFPKIKIIQAKENLGFAGANNLALKQVQTDYVMLLNTDTQLDERSDIDGMIAYLQTHPKVGMIGPKLVLSDGEIDFASHRGEPTLWASFTYFSKLEKLFPRWRFFSHYHRGDLDLNTIHQIDAISGAAMIVTKKALQKVGPLDDNFFLYAEDLDWCKRFRDAGFQIVYYPSAVIIHHKNKSGIENESKDIKGNSRKYFYTTMLQYYDKHYAQHYPSWVRNFIRGVLFVKKEGFGSST